MRNAVTGVMLREEAEAAEEAREAAETSGRRVTRERVVGFADEPETSTAEPGASPFSEGGAQAAVGVVPGSDPDASDPS